MSGERSVLYLLQRLLVAAQGGNAASIVRGFFCFNYYLIFAFDPAAVSSRISGFESANLFINHMD